jgi:hypothetical protein
VSRKSDGLNHIGGIGGKLLEQLKCPSAIEKRLIQGAAYRVENPDEAQSLVFQHTVLYQTCLPFRDPGDEVRTPGAA